VKEKVPSPCHRVTPSPCHPLRPHSAANIAAGLQRCVRYTDRAWKPSEASSHLRRKSPQPATPAPRPQPPSASPLAKPGIPRTRGRESPHFSRDFAADARTRSTKPPGPLVGLAAQPPGLEFRRPNSTRDGRTSPHQNAIPPTDATISARHSANSRSDAVLSSPQIMNSVRDDMISPLRRANSPRSVLVSSRGSANSCRETRNSLRRHIISLRGDITSPRRSDSSSRQVTDPLRRNINRAVPVVKKGEEIAKTFPRS